MDTATLLLLAIGLLGAFDIAWFHTWKGRLVTRAESRREAFIHVVRGFVYAAQFLVIPRFRFQGAWFLALALLFVIDAGIACADVLEEPRSRASQGGLSGGEYLMHVVLSVLVGAMLHAVFSAHWLAWRAPTRLLLEAHGPAWARSLALVMAAGSTLTSLVELVTLIGARLPAPAPLHVRIRLRASLAEVWNTTQDHRLHPSWDHRFDRIEMLFDEARAPAPDAAATPLGMPDPRIETGTRMRYEKSVLGLTIRGFGRYKLHRPMRQSTFEFWSDDAPSLIRRGVGLWLYTPLGGGLVEFSTSYTYDVRWGGLGRVIDRVLFRPLFQRYTEASFRRLAREHFGERRPIVLGRTGRHPQRFPTFAEIA